MAELSIEMTYGNALLLAANETQKVDIILKEISEVLDVFQREKELYSFFINPTIAGKEKKAVIGKIFSGQVCEEILNFLYVLIDKGRMRHFPKIVKTYIDLVDREEGCAIGVIYSVKPLNEEQLKQFEEKTGKLIKEKVKLKNKIDASLIGGIKILIDGKIIDASFKRRLKDLSGAIK